MTQKTEKLVRTIGLVLITGLVIYAIGAAMYRDLTLSIQLGYDF
ncbi:hypothetical protein SAMN04488524_0608 [Pedobacter africanus]|uniref:Uncharacterized protein n=1 Tax=Pedobacter africanus TaxID=151894 RepID=A0A1W1ZCU5_9SPHI|nr:hypothetical protein SAMN04488524_0608 [Pedobacter africanus]